MELISLLKQSQLDVGTLTNAIAKTSDINAADERGRTPLHWASLRYESAEFVKQLLQAGAQIDPIDTQGATPLFLALGQSPETVQILLQAGANANHHGPSGYAMEKRISCLRAAIQFRKSRMVELLLQYGAKADAVENGKTAYQYALGRNFLEIAKLFDTNAEQAYAALPETAEVKRLQAEILQILQDGGCWRQSGREETLELRYDTAQQKYVSEMYDPLILNPQGPVSSSTLTPDEVLHFLCTPYFYDSRHNDSELSIHQAARASLTLHPRTEQKQVTPEMQAVAQMDFTRVNTLPSGLQWQAEWIKCDMTFIGATLWPHAFFKITVSSHRPPLTFEWKIPLERDGSLQKNGADGILQTLAKRLESRLAGMGHLDFSKPQMLKDNFTWTAQHTSRFEDHDLQWRFSIHVFDAHQTIVFSTEGVISKPGTERWEQEFKGAQTKLRKQILKAWFNPLRKP